VPIDRTALVRHLLRRSEPVLLVALGLHVTLHSLSFGTSPLLALAGVAAQIIGVHMVGPWVTEQLAGGYLAVNWEATVEEVAHFIQPHPSLSELFGETMLSLTGRSFNG
jgi:xanthosine utilization system XapX-like protein